MCGDIRIGTSGWSYEHWTGSFYPKGWPRKNLLKYYAQQLSTVEINSSFYRLPDAKSLAAWRNQVPKEFVFAAKASRYITHMKKLGDSGASLSRFLSRMETLGEKLGPVLFQLPPRWSFNPERLGDFLALLRGPHRYAFEFRDRSWFNEKSCALLAEHNAALCIYDLAGWTSPKRRTADFVYVRLHGPRAAYRGSYGLRELRQWAAAFAAWSAQGCAVYCYFDNDEAGYAAQNALRLRKMLAESTSS